jgi:hypothetical protein
MRSDDDDYAAVNVNVSGRDYTGRLQYNITTNNCTRQQLGGPQCFTQQPVSRAN